MTDIAITGISARMPMAASLDEFHHNLYQGRDAVRELPAERRRFSAIEEPEPQVAGYLDRVDLFDPELFKISRRDAERMDPQQRILLELAVEAITSAGYSLDALRGTNTAVLVGAGDSGYLDLQAGPDASVVSGNLLGPLAGRLSYLFDLRGPALVIETACSSALVAVHEACSKLACGDIDCALAGGITVFIRMFRKDEGEGVLGVVSPDGRSRSFDAAANGTGLGEGGGLVVLKRLDDALRDRDPVRAVIKGSAINQDGGRSNGLTAPSPAAQAEVLTAAWTRAGIDPGTIGYIEAHGTGTQLGDPIEISGLRQAFSRYTGARHTCAVSTVKSNIGHLGYAAGVAGLIKVVLALERRCLYPSLHFHQPNPLIDLGGAVYINTEARDWQAEGPRRAGVSSFGVSGTNAHVVLEEAPARDDRAAGDDRGYVLALSARSPRGLGEYARSLRAAVAARPRHRPWRLGDVTHTLSRGRDLFPVRAARVVSSWDQLAVALDEISAAAGALAGAPEGGPRAAGERMVVALVSDHAGGYAEPSVQAARAAWPALDRALEQCATLDESAGEPGARAFAHAYAVHALLCDLGVTPGKLIGAGPGNALVAATLGRATVAEALTRAVDAVRRPRDINRRGLEEVVAGLRARGHSAPLFIEIGPPGQLGRELVSLWPAATVLRTAAGDALRSPLDIIAEVYERGGAIDWGAHYADRDARRVPLPGPPLERVRCWIREPLPEGYVPARAGEPEDPAAAGHSAPAGHSAIHASDIDIDGATATERRLAALWARVLGSAPGSRDAEFQDHGGDSLNGVELVELIAREFGVALDALDLLDHGPLADMAAYIDELRDPAAEDATGAGDDPTAGDSTAAAPATAAPPAPAEAPLSSAQAQLYYLWQLDPKSAFYNIPAALRLEGALDVDALRAALEALVHRHPVLRTTYDSAGPRQIVTPPSRLELPVIDLCEAGEPGDPDPSSASSDMAARLAAHLRDHHGRPFDLAADLMLRAALYRLAGTVHVLSLSLHHIAADGWAFGILMRELSALYRAHSTGEPSGLAPPAATYTEFAAWQRAHLDSDDGRAQLAYWTELLAPPVPELALPETARPGRAGGDRFRGVRRPVELPARWRRGVEHLARDQGATPFMVLLAGFAALLHRYSGQTDLVIGTPVANRPEAFRDVVGLFSNTLPLRIDASGDPPFRELVRRVKALCRGAFANQAVPFERIVRAVQPERKSDRSPLLRAVFALQNVPTSQAALPGVEVTPIELEGNTSRFDLSLSLRATGTAMAGVVEYRDDLFTGAAIDRLLGHYQRLVAAAVAEPDTALSRLAYLSDDERRTLAETWSTTTSASDFDL